jgi:pimeloyl-ACP methyl ester carboxylesterase
MVDRIPKTSLVKIKNGGHGIMYQFPETFSETVIRFLEEPLK